MTDFNNEYDRFTNPEDDFQEYNEPDEFDSQEEEYTVGYGRPPKHTQFKKGHSGNPKGKPKASKNPTEALAKELSKTIPIKVNGKIKNVKTMELIAKKAIQMALKGNISILKKLLESPIIDPCLFKEAMNKYNYNPKDEPKALSPEFRMIVNKLKEMGREAVERKEYENLKKYNPD